MQPRVPYHLFKLRRRFYRDGILIMRNRSGWARFVSCLAVALVAICGVSNRQVLGVTLPVAGTTLVGYSYYGTALPFVDVAHMSDRWLSVVNGAVDSNSTVAVN